MNKKNFRVFEKLIKEENLNPGSEVLEIGAVPKPNTLLNSKVLKDCQKTGLSLEHESKFKDFKIIKGNANKMNMFKDDSFDCVLCNATLEHDKYFWKSLDEISRVIKKDGLFIVGVPGYRNSKIKNLIKKIPFSSRFPFLIHPRTFKVHNWPGDFYRFSRQTIKDVFLNNFRNKKIIEIGNPTRIIGKGRYNPD